MYTEKKCYLDNVPTLPKEKEERVDSRSFSHFLKTSKKKGDKKIYTKTRTLNQATSYFIKKSFKIHKSD